MDFRKRKKAVSSGLFHQLAARNVRKSAKDYFIYFFTLMLSVCLFYSFNSISTQFASLGLEDPLNYLAFSSSVLTAFSVLVCVIMGALVVYANRFLLRRRKKEMGIYAVLGMERKDLNRLLMRETFRIGIFSLIAGLFLGVFAAQILSLITAKIIGISLASYHFMISVKAILLSIVFFGILFFFVHRFNVRELKKMSLLDMLNADRKNETSSEGNRLFTVLLAVLSVLFLLGGYGFLTVMAERDAFKALALGTLLLIAGTVFFFSAFLKIAVRFMKKRKRFSYRKLHMFTAGQFSSQLRTGSISIAMTSILLYLSMVLIIIGPGIGKFLTNGIENADPYDATVSYAPNADHAKNALNPMEGLVKAGFSVKSFSNEYGSFWIYDAPDSAAGLFSEEQKIPAVIGIEDYNRILKLQNIAPVRLGAGEYAVNYAFPASKNSTDPKPVKIGRTVLTMAEKGIWHHALENKNALIDGGTLIVPQQLVKNLTPQRWCLNLNLSEKAKNSGTDLREKWISASADSYAIWTRQEVMMSLASDNLLMTYLGIYLGITFLITAGAALALQQLSRASENAKRYGLLKKLGVSRKDRNRLLQKELKIYFGFPLFIAVLNSAAAVTAIFRNFHGLAPEVIISVSGISTLLVFTVYAVYYFTTYFGNKRILKL
ncbi:ABC transporter permease [Anaerostipes sp.]|uniref:ABC transporter permease n=1 Tax=Anaerostipes sp. TaxID=1872530 RepID=UPI0025C3C570|nr:ABC transporter permease [Anaerostipes sp.]MBS7009210.1 ABC transporter permease [Anaerostipes sp.]